MDYASAHMQNHSKILPAKKIYSVSGKEKQERYGIMTQTNP